VRNRRCETKGQGVSNLPGETTGGRASNPAGETKARSASKRPRETKGQRAKSILNAGGGDVGNEDAASPPSRWLRES
jgi:hypothetical protein